MNLKNYLSRGVLLLLVGANLPLYSLQRPPEKRDKPRTRNHEDRPQSPVERAPEPRPESSRGSDHSPRRDQPPQRDRHREEPPAHSARDPRPQPLQNLPTRQPEQRAEPQREPSYRPQQPRPRYDAEHRNVWQQHRAGDWKVERRSWDERGGYRGYRIPRTRFRRSFGPSHFFHLSYYPVFIFRGHPRFQYGGFWFTVLDPWPEYWSDNWYDQDEVYIEFSGNGYYLYNRRYSGDRISLSVTLN